MLYSCVYTSLEMWYLAKSEELDPIIRCHNINNRPADAMQTEPSRATSDDGTKTNPTR